MSQESYSIVQKLLKVKTFLTLTSSKSIQFSFNNEIRICFKISTNCWLTDLSKCCKKLNFTNLLVYGPLYFLLIRPTLLFLKVWKIQKKLLIMLWQNCCCWSTFDMKDLLRFENWPWIFKVKVPYKSFLFLSLFPVLHALETVQLLLCCLFKQKWLYQLSHQF